jgi:hypothetical protein
MIYKTDVLFREENGCSAVSIFGRDQMGLLVGGDGCNLPVSRDDIANVIEWAYHMGYDDGSNNR